MPRRFWILHYEDLLEYPADFSTCRRQLNCQVQAGKAGGTHLRAQGAQAHFPQTQTLNATSQKATQKTLGISWAFAQLLRVRRNDGRLGHAGTSVQQDRSRDTQLRPDVLWAWLQHSPVHPDLAVQLQVPLVLSRDLQPVQWEDGGVHLQVMARKLCVLLGIYHLHYGFAYGKLGWQVNIAPGHVVAKAQEIGDF